MAKISNTTSYPNATAASTDYVIGTDVSDNNNTKTFTLQDIANLFVGAGSGTVTSVGISGASTGLTFTSDTANPIVTTGTFTLGGSLGFANGGTGLTALGIAGDGLKVNAGATGFEYVPLVTISGTTAAGILSRGSASTADVSPNIIVAGTQMLFDTATPAPGGGNTGLNYDLGTTTFQVGDMGGGTDTVSIYSAGTESLIVSSTVSQFKNSSHTVFDNGVRFTAAGATTLNAYEEGTWTANIVDNSSPAAVFGTSTGNYTVIGNIVRGDFAMTITSSATVNIFALTLPFAPAENNSAVTMTSNASANSGTASTKIITGKVVASTSRAIFLTYRATAGTTAFGLAFASPDNSVTAGNVISGSFVYRKS